MLQSLIAHAQASDMAQLSRILSELFDLKPTQARRAASTFVRELAQRPELARRMEDLSLSLESANEYSAATLLVECFEFQAIDALSLVRALKSRPTDPDVVR